MASLVSCIASFTLDVEAGSFRDGEVVGLMGENGGGKSTVVNLIERFYLPESGTITIDGLDLGTIDPMWLRSMMALVQQKKKKKQNLMWF